MHHAQRGAQPPASDTCVTAPHCPPPPWQGLTPANIYLQSQQLESLLAYHTLPTPLR